jgi:GT2 family glycosyltransferase
VNTLKGTTAPEKVFIGIPILNRLDFLQRCLQSIDHAAEIVIVNNNSIDRGFSRDLQELAEGRQITVLHQARNLGVAASWNLILRTGFERGHHWVFIGSNDTFLTPGSIRAALDMPKDPAVGVWNLREANFFLINKATVDSVGWFDENFYPAYKEDQDYFYRCRLSGLKWVEVPGAGASHIGSATIHSNPDYHAHNQNTHFNWNLNHYKMKWGGDARDEQYTTPYNRSDVDHRWWPDPSGSIAVRDWDNGFRETGAPKRHALNELQDIGIRHCTDKATRHYYMEYYFRYLNPLRHRKLVILELGVASGASLRTWKEFCGNATIVGVDSNPASEFREERIHVRIGDATRREFTDEIASKFGPFDVIIDDASHQVSHQQASFENLFPKLASGGMYVIEDLHTSFWPQYGGSDDGASTGVIGTLKESIPRICRADGCFTGEIEGLAFYPGICFVWKRA